MLNRRRHRIRQCFRQRRTNLLFQSMRQPVTAMNLWRSGLWEQMHHDPAFQFRQILIRTAMFIDSFMATHIQSMESCIKSPRIIIMDSLIPTGTSGQINHGRSYDDWSLTARFILMRMFTRRRVRISPPAHHEIVTRQPLTHHEKRQRLLNRNSRNSDQFTIYEPLPPPPAGWHDPSLPCHFNTFRFQQPIRADWS